MPTVRRSRVVAAPPERVWEVVADPHHMPRWWPGVQRMEGVQGGFFTQVFITRKGRSVRADHHLLESDAPGPAGEPPGRVRWAQEVAGTPFERVLSEAVTEVVVAGAGDASAITISKAQKLRGYSRTGGFLLRRATRRQLDEALEGLERVLG